MKGYIVSISRIAGANDLQDALKIAESWAEQLGIQPPYSVQAEPLSSVSPDAIDKLVVQS